MQWGHEFSLGKNAHDFRRVCHVFKIINQGDGALKLSGPTLHMSKEEIAQEALADEQMQSRDFAGAEQTLEGLVETRWGDADLFVKLGNSERLQGKQAEALKAQWRPGEAVFHNNIQALYPFKYYAYRESLAMPNWVKNEVPALAPQAEGYRAIWRKMKGWFAEHGLPIDGGMEASRGSGAQLFMQATLAVSGLATPLNSGPGHRLCAVVMPLRLGMRSCTSRMFTPRTFTLRIRHIH